MVLPCRKAVFTSQEFIVHWLDDIMQQDNRSPSLEQVGLSVLKFCSSSKPLAHKRALIIFFSLTTFFHYPSQGSALLTQFRHWLSYIILASSCYDLFILNKVSWIWVSSSFISFKDRLDRPFDNSSSFFDFVLGSFVISHCSIFARPVDNRCPSLLEIFQQFEYFPVAFPVRFIISAFIQLLSLLSSYLMVECGFNFFIGCECCDIFSFRVSGCDDCDECDRCVVVSNGWDDCDEHYGWYSGWIEFLDEYDGWMGFSDECDECDSISYILWLFSGSSDNSESVSYDCCSFSADIDWLLNR